MLRCAVALQQVSIGTKGPKVCQSDTTSSLSHWFKAGCIHTFMFFRAKSDSEVLVRSSVVVVHLLQGLTCCVSTGSCCCLSIISNRSAHSPVTSDINKIFCPHNYRSLYVWLFFRPFSSTLEIDVYVNPRRSAVSEKHTHSLSGIKKQATFKWHEIL